MTQENPMRNDRQAWLATRRTPNKTASDLFNEANLAKLKQTWFATGSLQILTESLELTRTHSMPLEAWQYDALLHLVDCAFRGKKKTGQNGRNSIPSTAFYARMADYMRFNFVRQIDQEENRSGSRRRTSLEQIYEIAAADLNRFASIESTAETVRKSYQRVNRDLRNGKDAKYHDVGLLP